ncbi:oxidoreductase [Nocardia donostiensis]|uniref:PQQ-dependent sugar dehydrogenase n=1 Tax=Nocardia donostiensis TaxID=1538463 RepID=UPI0009DACFCA|nr:PQQ-dependent sugar dehydrogenase [Nocardia donostiensis]OQS14806.1 oxidoreductase [Nocardia donostiensis]
MKSVGAKCLAVGVVLGSLMLGGCARFDDSASSPFTPEPTLHGANIDPRRPQQPPTSTTRPSGPCIDPDPAVVATCLDTTGGMVSLGQSALVTERRTGRILQVAPEQPPLEVAQVDVDPAGDGGLSDLALSPTYGEDGLLYAYITTPSDNRVVRIAPDGPPKPVLTGIPKGTTGNRGAIEFVGPDELLVLTGDAGDPGAASNASSLAGKLLRVHSPSPGGTPPPEVAVSGIGSAGDICLGGDQIWITDRTPAQDRLQRIGPDGVVTTAWTWPDRPGVAGCATTPEGVAISLTGAKALALAIADPVTHAVTAPPTLIAQDRYGRLIGAGAGSDGTIWVSTANKSEGGAPGPYDDRVVRIPPPSGAGGGPD